MNASIPQAVTDAIVGYLGKVGINVKTTVKDNATWLAGMRGKPDLRQGMFVQVLNWDVTFEAVSVWRWYSPSELTAENGARWQDQTFDKLYQTARSEPDDGKRAAIFQQAGKYLNEQAPVLFLWPFPRPAALAKTIKWQGGYFADMYGMLSKT